MDNCIKIATTVEVWRAIKAKHNDDLVVFACYSHPDGDPYGDPDEGEMYTVYGFEGADYPLMGAITTWRIDREKPCERNDVVEKFWLYITRKEEEEEV